MNGCTISTTINTLNPCPIPVDTADQPTFALTKELMIRFPDKFGADKCFSLFRSLHIVKSLLIIKGTLSGLRQLLATESPLIMIKKCFLINLKSAFRCQGIQVFVLTFWSCGKTT